MQNQWRPLAPVDNPSYQGCNTSKPAEQAPIITVVGQLEVLIGKLKTIQELTENIETILVPIMSGIAPAGNREETEAAIDNSLPPLVKQIATMNEHADFLTCRLGNIIKRIQL